MKQPVVFLSSTIYDFRDLRSAIKFYLEQQGCTVLASEFNDFQKPLDAHSYDACLAAIGMADYFILLIGSRVGGWYDAANRISITQQEYRVAYERHKQGRLNIVTFVRSEVWQVREDRKALARHLETLNLTEAEKQGVMTSPSKFANDAQFISSFIDEVGKNKETKKAVESGGVKPTGNWIHVFKDFSEIIGTIQPLLFRGFPVDEAVFRKALEAELMEILAVCMLKHKGAALSPIGGIYVMRERCPIKVRVKQGLEITLPVKEWDQFSTLMLHLLAVNISVVVLPDALSASTFFEFDRAAGAFRETGVSRALAKLMAEIKRFNEFNTADTLSVIYAHTPNVRPRNLTEIEVDASQLALLYHLSYRWGNTIILCEALLHHLRGGEFVEPTLFPFSPIQGLDEKINEERVSRSEIVHYLDEQRERHNR